MLRARRLRGEEREDEVDRLPVDQFEVDRLLQAHEEPEHVADAGEARMRDATPRSRHARFAGVSHVLGLFVRLEKPVDFKSINRQPVDLVFALFAPKSAGAEHLKALARVSRTLRSEAVCAKLRSTFDPSRRSTRS